MWIEVLIIKRHCCRLPQTQTSHNKERREKKNRKETKLLSSWQNVLLFLGIFLLWLIFVVLFLPLFCFFFRFWVFFSRSLLPDVFYLAENGFLYCAYVQRRNWQCSGRLVRIPCLFTWGKYVSICFFFSSFHFFLFGCCFSAGNFPNKFLRYFLRCDDN